MRVRLFLLTVPEIDDRVEKGEGRAAWGRGEGRGEVG